MLLAYATNRFWGQYQYQYQPYLHSRLCMCLVCAMHHHLHACCHRADLKGENNSSRFLHNLLIRIHTQLHKAAPRSGRRWSAPAPPNCHLPRPTMALFAGCLELSPAPASRAPSRSRRNKRLPETR